MWVRVNENGSATVELSVRDLSILAHVLEGMPDALTSWAQKRLDDEDRGLVDELRRQVQGADRLSWQRRQEGEHVRDS